MKLSISPSKHSCCSILVALTLIAVNHAKAQNYAPPASDLQILDLAGTAVPDDDVVTDYSASFVATSTDSTVTFVFRDDPGYFTFDDASVADSNAPAINLLTNGTFTEGGATSEGGGSPGWTNFQQDGVDYLGQQLAGGGWYDGATGGYDGIDQSITTVAGDTYYVTFDLSQVDTEGVSLTDYQQISTNGEPSYYGNGIDMLVYAGDGIPTTSTSVPEPSTWAMLVGGLGMLFLWRKRKRQVE